jgi:Ca2+-binding RTX toxin-like protein
MAGEDSVAGGTGNDLLLGNPNRDTLDGGTGDDTLIGGSGDDSLIGGAGIDLAHFRTTGSVTVDLGIGTSSSSTVHNDNLTGIENVLGADGDDSILGDGLANMLDGWIGNDTLSAGGGDDTVNGGFGDDNLDGGVGNDLLSYAGATGGVTVDMGAGRATASADTISGFESVQGSANNDNLLGNSSANGLFGEDGNDTISAGGGNDTVLGGNGADSLAGGDGADSILGGDGVDTLTGGAGNDWLDFGAGNDTFSYQTSDGFGNETLDGGAGQDTLDLGLGWRSGPFSESWKADGWVNYQRIDGTFIFTRHWESVVCFAEGTRIMTPGGEVAVENLRAGDMVLAMRNGKAGFEALRWVGSMDVAVPRDAVIAAKTAPILIKVGALADRLPARDLRVSPDHAIEVDGYLIPAKHLVNGTSILQEAWCQRVSYFHLELEAHGLLLSEGLWSESYLDDGNRHAFNNAGLTGLFLDFEVARSAGQYDTQTCMPVLREGLALDLIHGRISLRAQQLTQFNKAKRRGPS